MNRSRRKLLGIVTTAMALAATAFASGGQTPAQADSALANVTGFRTTNISISSRGCKDVPVTMYVSYSQPTEHSVTSLTTHIYPGQPGGGLRLV